jgi:glycosyltransferase involved in cell wall biosynthesis
MIRPTPPSGQNLDTTAKPNVLNRLLKDWGGPDWRRKPRRARTPEAQSLPRISVIIPIHGTEKYVEKCVRSVMAQTLREIEIICVDDASPDNSAAIVERLMREDGLIRLIRHDRNLGLGGARNTGIAAARAPYVTGVDSDDYILPEMMERLWEASGDGAADIVVSGFARVNPDGSLRGPSVLPQAGQFRNDNGELDIFEFLKPSFCIKIWKKSLFDDHGIRFPENTYFEDLAVTPQLVHFAKDIRVVSEDLYQYLIRPGSITNSYGVKHLIDHFRVFDILDGFLVREGLVERYGAGLIERICRSQAFHAANVTASGIDLAEKEQYLRFMLMLQVGYIDYKDRLRGVPPGAMQACLRTAKSGKALDVRLSRQAGTEGST